MTYFVYFMYINRIFCLHVGVGMFGVYEPISNNSALIANENNDIGTITCHSSTREEDVGRWISLEGNNITSNLSSLLVEQFHGPFPSYVSLQLNNGTSLGVDDQGVYTCLIPDENGEERALHVGIYRNDYDGMSMLQVYNYMDIK